MHFLLLLLFFFRIGRKKKREIWVKSIWRRDFLWCSWQLSVAWMVVCVGSHTENQLQMLGKEGATRAAGPHACACPQGSQRDRQLHPPMLVTVDEETHPSELAWCLWVCAALHESKGVWKMFQTHPAVWTSLPAAWTMTDNVSARLPRQ